MTKHSKKYYQKQNKLNLQEDLIKGELEEESVKAEKSLYTFLKFAGITAAILGIGYLIVKYFTGGDDSKETTVEKSKEIKEKSFLSPLIANFTTKLSEALIAGVINYVTGFVKKKDTGETTD